LLVYFLIKVNFLRTDEVSFISVSLMPTLSLPGSVCVHHGFLLQVRFLITTRRVDLPIDTRRGLSNPRQGLILYIFQYPQGCQICPTLPNTKQFHTAKYTHEWDSHPDMSKTAKLCHDVPIRFSEDRVQKSRDKANLASVSQEPSS